MSLSFTPSRRVLALLCTIVEIGIKEHSGPLIESVAGMIICGFAGTWIGLHLLSKFSNASFQRGFNWLLTVLALRLIWQAASSYGVFG